MARPVSSEFIDICEAQVDVLADVLGASLCIVYLTDDSLSDESGHLVPLISRPKNLMTWAQSDLLAWLEHAYGWNQQEQGSQDERQIGLFLPSQVTDDTVQVAEGSPEKGLRIPGWNKSLDGGDTPPSPDLDTKRSPNLDAIAPLRPTPSTPEHHQIMLPLVYEGVMVGLLVTARPDRLWDDQEHHQIEQIAKTLTMACVLDQRAHWLEGRLQSQVQTRFHEQQHDVFDDLIHQFRNPLTALRTFGKLLMRRLQPGDRNFGVAESIVRESDRLQELLQQFKAALDVETPTLPQTEAQPRPILNAQFEEHSHCASGASQTSKEDDTLQPTIDIAPSASYLTGHDISLAPCSLATVLAPLLDVAWAIAQEQSIHLHVDISSTLAPVMADAKGLQEVFSNLIDNAIKYTPEGGEVLICAPDQPTMRQAVIVADTGPGIPPEDRKHLFERHFRGVQAQGTIPGTGLGLAIARDLLRQMDASVEVFSPATETDLLSNWPQIQPEHPGTAFVVWLRKAVSLPNATD